MFFRTSARSTVPDHFELGRRAVNEIPIRPGSPPPGRWEIADTEFSSRTHREPRHRSDQ